MLAFFWLLYIENILFYMWQPNTLVISFLYGINIYIRFLNGEQCKWNATSWVANYARNNRTSFDSWKSRRNYYE